MIIRVGMAPRRVGDSCVQFQRHWCEEHAAAALQIPGLRGYVQNHSLLDDTRRPLLPYPGFDACAETAFDDLETMDAGFASPQYQQTVRADEALLIDKARFFNLLCERVVLDEGSGEEDGVKLMSFLRVHPLAERDDLLDVVTGSYTELVRAAGATRHVVLVPSPTMHEGRGTPCCDLVDSVWFPTVADALAVVGGSAAGDIDGVLAGRVFGRERLVAAARIMRGLPNDDRRMTSDEGVGA